MKRFFLIVTAILLSACVAAEPKIPAELVGIWANEGAVLHEGKWLMSDQALYLGADGNGVGGDAANGASVVSIVGIGTGYTQIINGDQIQRPRCGDNGRTEYVKFGCSGREVEHIAGCVDAITSATTGQ